MASSTAEALWGRTFSWMVVAGNALISVLLIAALPWVAREGLTALQWAVYAALVSSWSLGTVQLALLLVVRKRHTVDDLVAASPADGSALHIPGSARASAAAAATAASLAALAGLTAAAVSGGWRIAAAVVAVALVFAAADQFLATRQRRYVVLSGDSLEVGGFTGSASVRWEDVARIGHRQGYGGLLVLRVEAGPDATSWRRLTKHPWHRTHRTLDLEPLALDVGPTTLAEVVLTLWKDAQARRHISAHTLAARMTVP